MPIRNRPSDRSQIPRPYAGDEQRADQIRALSDAILRGRVNEGTQHLETETLVVILDQDLNAPTTSKKPEFAWATVCQWDEQHGAYLEPTDYEDQQTFDDEQALTDDERDILYEADPTKVKVANHSEYTDHVKNTFGEAKWKDAHWWFFGDCGEMAERRFDIEAEE